MEQKTKDCILEKMNELKELCEQKGVPVVIAIAEEKNGTTEYIKEVVTPLQCRAKLTNDLITPSIVIFDNDFQIIPNVNK